MARICKYGCGTMLEGFDEDKRRYIEYGTTDCLHTKERCQEAKANRTKNAGDFDKDDHGNESYSPKVNGDILKQGNETTELKGMYVDHTLKGASKVKIFHSNDPDEVEFDYNDFLKTNNGKIKTQGAQFQFDAESPRFAIALYYEEVK